MTLVLLQKAPPCEHATQKAPCCAGCQRSWYQAAFKQHVAQQKTEKEAGS